MKGLIRNTIMGRMALSAVVPLLLGLQMDALHAQTTSITSSGLNTTINSSGTTTFIDGGTRPGAGPNLFHSFGEFSIGEGHTALFRNSDAAATSNIFGRVTGGNESRIFGTIDSATNFPTANLWLLNPAGFFFGPTASLNVGGSVNISTADYLRMADGKQFFADASKNSVLSMEPVAAFGFTAPRPITIQGSALAVLPGRSLSIVGGDLEITGRFNESTETPEDILFAPSGRIQLASVASPGEVVIGATASGLPDLNVDSFSQLGNVTLSNVAILNASGDPGGMVQIRGGGLTMDGSLIVANTLGNFHGAAEAADIDVTGATLLQNGSIIQSITGGEGRSGDILIKSGELDVRSGSSIFTRNFGVGQCGNINLQIGTLIGSAGASVFSESRGTAAIAGSAGQITVQGITGPGSAANRVSLDSSTINTRVVGGTLTSAPASIDIAAHTIELTNNASLQSLTTGSIRAGDISLAAPGVITLIKGSQITSSTRLGTGNAGGVFIRAPSITLADSPFVSSSTRGIGNAGTILIDGTTVSVTKGATINSGTFGVGNAGEVIVRAAESITVSGTDPQSDNRSAIASAAIAGLGSGEIGAAGTVTITAPVITISDQANIFTSNAIDSGKAGDIILDGRQVAVLAGAQIQSSTTSSSAGGSVKIMAEESLTISDANSQGGKSRIATGTLGKGDAGQIVIRTSTLTMNGGEITASSLGLRDAVTGELILSSGSAGSIDIAAKNAVLTNGVQIQTSSLGSGEGGRIGIVARESFLLSGGESIIGSSTSGPKNAGQITLSAPTMTLMDGAFVSAFSDGLSVTDPSRGTGQAGAVTLQAARLNITTGARVDSSTFAAGSGGLLTIKATERVHIGGTNSTGLTTITTGEGNAGTIFVMAPVVDLQRGVIISNTGASGDAGTVTIQAGQVSIGNGAVIASRGRNSATGDGGNVNVLVTGLLSGQGSTVSSEALTGAGGDVLITAGNVQLTEGTTILAKTTGSKNAGNIALTSGSDIVMRNTTVTTSADQASGGNIKLTAPNVISLFDSQLTSSVKGQVGSNGGNISIDPVAVSIQNSQLLANANAGAGGNITVAASGAVLVSSSSTLDASAGPAGVSGSVNINAPIQVLGGTLVPLKVSYSQPALSGDRCAADPQGRFSSFVQTGRDGVPQIPGGYAPSPLLPLNRLMSSLPGASGPRLAMVRLGLTNMGVLSPNQYQFQSGCRS